MNKTVDIDKGAKRILQDFKEANRSHVTIGVHEDAGEYTEESIPVSVVATTNEFGSKDGRIPERSFMRSTIDENKNNLHENVKDLTWEILKRKLRVKNGLDKLGFKIQELIKGKILKLTTPPNAPSTVERKGSNNPLVDSRLLWRTINFKSNVKK